MACFIKWSNSVQVRETIEPLDAVMALAMGTHYRVGDESVLQSLCTSDECSQILRHIIQATAKSLGWRVVRTRDGVTVSGDVEAGDDPSGANLEAEMAERLAEAKSAFLLYDKVTLTNAQYRYYLSLSPGRHWTLTSLQRRMEEGPLTLGSFLKLWLPPIWRSRQKKSLT